jgi:hypothetical protein
LQFRINKAKIYKIQKKVSKENKWDVTSVKTSKHIKESYDKMTLFFVGLTFALSYIREQI